MRHNRTERGFGLLFLMIVIVSLGTIMAVISIETSQSQEKKAYSVLGNKIAEHSRAVAEWIVDNSGTAIPASYTTTDWLKSNVDCGITTGGTRGYLPCDFTFSTSRFGDTPTTIISNSAGVTTAVTTWPALTEAGTEKVIGAAYVVNHAEAFGGDELGGLVTYTDDLSGVITATVDVTNGSSIYVKRSGDSMTGSLDMGSNDLNTVGVITATLGAFNTSTLGTATANSVTANSLVAATGNITTVTSSTMTSENSAITNFTTTNTTTSDWTVNGTATLNNLDGNMQIQSIKDEDETCAGAGRLARTTEGALLNCKGGTWQTPQAGSAGINYSACYNVTWGNAVYYNACPTDYVFVGAGKNPNDSGEWRYFKCCHLN